MLVREQTASSPSGPVRVSSAKVVFTISGWARVQGPSGDAFLEAGSILTIPPGMECHGFPEGYTRTVTFYIHADYLADQLRWLPVTHPLVHHLHGALNGCADLQTLQLASTTMHALTPALLGLTQPRADWQGDFAMLSNASEVFDAVGRFSGVSTGNRDVAGMWPRREIAVAIALLRADLSRPWRVDELAREISVSPAHLARLFRAQIGISPAAFLRQIRADHMAELLLTTDLTVRDAGAAVGWEDAAVASRSFKQRHGVAPRVYASTYRRSVAKFETLPRQSPKP